MACHLAPSLASTKSRKTASKMAKEAATKMARCLVATLTSTGLVSSSAATKDLNTSDCEDGSRGRTKKGLKDGCVSGIEDGPPLGVKLGIDKGAEDGW
jgi:hypothetical protein